MSRIAAAAAALAGIQTNQDAEYAKKNQLRREKAIKWADKEIRKLIAVMISLGRTTKFGQLFKATVDDFEAISGTLVAAKKRDVVAFDGPVLLMQGHHDDVVIRLLKDTIPDTPMPGPEPEKKTPVPKGKTKGLEGTASLGPEKCATCGKTVYMTERLGIAGKVYHSEGCFKCNQCGLTLRADNFCSVNGKIWCQPHYTAMSLSRTGFIDETTAPHPHPSKPAASTPAKATPAPTPASTVTPATITTTATSTTSEVDDSKAAAAAAAAAVEAEEKKRKAAAEEKARQVAAEEKARQAREARDAEAKRRREREEEDKREAGRLAAEQRKRDEEKAAREAEKARQRAQEEAAEKARKEAEERERKRREEEAKRAEEAERARERAAEEAARAAAQAARDEAERKRRAEEEAARKAQAARERQQREAAAKAEAERVERERVARIESERRAKEARERAEREEEARLAREETLRKEKEKRERDERARQRAAAEQAERERVAAAEREATKAAAAAAAASAAAAAAQAAAVAAEEERRRHAALRSAPPSKPAPSKAAPSKAAPTAPPSSTPSATHAPTVTTGVSGANTALLDQGAAMLAVLQSAAAKMPSITPTTVTRGPGRAPPGAPPGRQAPTRPGAAPPALITRSDGAARRTMAAIQPIALHFISHLDQAGSYETGLFRDCYAPAEVNALSSLIDKYLAGHSKSMPPLDDFSVSSVAIALIELLKVSQPIFSADAYLPLRQLQTTQRGLGKMVVLSEMINELSTQARGLLLALLELCYHVHEHQDVTQMHSGKLAALFHSIVVRPKAGTVAAVEDDKVIIALVIDMIEEFETLEESTAVAGITDAMSDFFAEFPQFAPQPVYAGSTQPYDPNALFEIDDE